ncbi:MAG: hypothetical protein RRA94_03645 [Bacteroidota bacterium]|nr:hypothetical protein [Bacteroidota bacterium]
MFRWRVPGTVLLDSIRLSGGGLAAFFEHSSGHLFFSVPGQSWLSPDDGDSWQKFTSFGESNVDAWSEDDQGNILCGSSIIRFPGLTVEAIPDVRVEGKRTRLRAAAATGDGYWIAWSGATPGWVLSRDRGSSWQVTERLEPHESLILIASSLNGNAVVQHGNAGVLYTTDRGMTWRRAAGTSERDEEIRQLLCPPEDGIYAISAFPGFQQLDTRSGEWLPRVKGMVQSPVSAIIGLPPQGALLAFTPLQRTLLRREAGSDDWRQLHRFDEDVSALSRLDDGTLLAVRRAEGISRSTDGGEHWLQVGPAGRTCECLLQLRDGRVLAGCTPGLLVSGDGGNSWQSVPEAETLNIEALCERSTGEVVIGGGFGVVVLATDFRVLQQSRPSLLPVLTLAGDSVGGIFAGTLGDGLHRSADGGVTWTQIGLEGEDITGIVAADEDFCFAATRRHGIFETRNGGRQWQALGIGLHTGEILNLYAGYDGFLYAGTVAGVAKSVLPLLTARYLAPDFSLSQSGPKPAIGSAAFTWSIPRAGNVLMQIYDILGRQQGVLLDRQATAGLHSEILSTDGLRAGTYFCVLHFEGKMLVEKFQVLR